MTTTSWSDLTLRQKVAFALCVSAGVTGLYVCYTQYRNRGEVSAARSRSDYVIPLYNAQLNLFSDDLFIFELQVKVPPDALKVIVGRQGSIRQKLQTDACIFVSEQPDCNGEYIVTITGSHAQVHQAQKALHSMLQESVLQVELLVPSRSIGRIIGKGGEKIQSMIRSSGAKISCSPKPEDSTAPTSNVTIVGTKEQVDAAKLLIQKILDEEPFQQQVAKSASFRCHRKEIIAVKKAAQKPAEERAVAQEEKLPRSQKDEVGTSKAHEDDRCNVGSSADNTSSISKFEVPSPDFNFQVDKYVDVYVSASENPQHFWIQIQGSRSSQLDKLSVEMSEYYKKQSSAEIQVGDIVAAPFPNNSTWYRAEVLKFLDNGNVDLYYVDYVSHAIACVVMSVIKGAEWTTPALDVFDEMSYCAMLKPLLAKICSFPSPGTSRYFEVQLCDPSFDPVSMLDIGQQLISRGFAVEQKESPLQEKETTLSRLMVSLLVYHVTVTFNINPKFNKSCPLQGEVLNPQPCNLSSQQEERSPASGEYGNMSFVILQALHVDI
uniref:Tudor and KH domain containing n=1 Tax=Leptobrachium leishanense TaxID=445787 RepID=A0A8C5QXZ9_9ANUR